MDNLPHRNMLGLLEFHTVIEFDAEDGHDAGFATTDAGLILFPDTCKWPWYKILKIVGWYAKHGNDLMRTRLFMEYPDLRASDEQYIIGLSQHSRDPIIKNAAQQASNTVSKVRMEQQRGSSAKDAYDGNNYVYVLKAKGQSLYKIGFTSREPTRRLQEFQPKLPFETSLKWTIQSENARQIETELHRLFSTKRKNGEWFELSPEDLEAIKTYAQDNGG